MLNHNYKITPLTASNIEIISQYYLFGLTFSKPLEAIKSLKIKNNEHLGKLKQEYILIEKK